MLRLTYSPRSPYEILEVQSACESGSRSICIRCHDLEQLKREASLSLLLEKSGLSWETSVHGHSIQCLKRADLACFGLDPSLLLGLKLDSAYPLLAEDRVIWIEGVEYPGNTSHGMNIERNAAPMPGDKKSFD